MQVLTVSASVLTLYYFHLTCGTRENHKNKNIWLRVSVDEEIFMTEYLIMMIINRNAFCSFLYESCLNVTLELLIVTTKTAHKWFLILVIKRSELWPKTSSLDLWPIEIHRLMIMVISFIYCIFIFKAAIQLNLYPMKWKIIKLNWTLLCTYYGFLERDLKKT